MLSKQDPSSKAIAPEQDTSTKAMAASLKLPHKCITDPAAAAANVHTAYIQAQLEQTYKNTYNIPNVQRQLYKFQMR